ncbi:hypothetical protein RDI58_015017 [Solanum bulbocastanum]|uniref:Uncharacterized protein n=1 Tax=Solanum bulbocastanum TaxID=147425 RepID=A0AAN8YBK0_SOLBU
MRALGVKIMVIMGDYDDSHDQEPNENESYYFGGEYERNVEHNSYGEDREEEGSCGSSYDDEGACERSYDGSYDEHVTLPTPRMKTEQTKLQLPGARMWQKKNNICLLVDTRTVSC